MKEFTPITSRVIPLPIKDVDTDLIIPAQFLTSVSKSGYGDALFYRLRGSDPTFPLNLPMYKGATILLADSNFGCGSSREHAVWALQGAGISVVLAPSFADIFAGNSAKNGLLLIPIPQSNATVLLEKAKNGGLTLGVDLESQRVFGEHFEYSFPYDPFRKHCLLNGIDDLDYLHSHEEEIREFFQENAQHRFFTIPPSENR